MDRMPKHKLLLNTKSYRMAHPVYSAVDLSSVKVEHQVPVTIKDKIAHSMINLIYNGYNLVTRYDAGKATQRTWLNRMIHLETVAGVPGMVGGMHRHLKSLRTLERDHGWIHHLV